jgi:hypothetical protein
MPIEFDTLDAELKLNDMMLKIRSLAETDIPQEFHDWQVEDMRRTYPEVEGPTFLTSETMIYPRSRTYSSRGKSRTAAPRRAPVRRRGIALQANRPILRPELFDKLVERMAEMLKDKLTWR